MEHVTLTTPSWTSGPVVIADTFYRRLRGVRIVPPRHALLLRAASVHGMGLSSPLTTVAFDRSGHVSAVGRLAPWRFWGRAGARMILEMDLEEPIPDFGERVAIRPIVGECPESSMCAPPPSAT